MIDGEGEGRSSSLLPLRERPGHGAAGQALAAPDQPGRALQLSHRDLRLRFVARRRVEADGPGELRHAARGLRADAARS